MTTQNPLGMGLDYARSLASTGGQIEQRRASQQRQGILGQQQERAGVVQGQQDQDRAIAQAQRQAKGLVDLSKGLMQLPIDQRMQAIQAQAPMLQGLDIDIAGLTPDAITDEGLTRIISTLGEQTSGAVSAGQQEFESLIGGFTQEEQDKARRIKAGLSARAVGSAPKISEYAGKKYMQIGEQLFPIQIGDDNEIITGDPTTIDQLAASEVSQPPVQPQLTPAEAAQEEIALTAQEAGAKSRAIAEATMDVSAGSQEAVTQKNKEDAFRRDTISVIDGLLGSEVGKVTGTAGRLPTFLPGTEDMLVQADRLESLLTAENMDIMTGVLSETDIKIISNLAGGFGLTRDENGNPVRIKGSEDAFRDRMETVRKGLYAVEIVPQLTAEMPDAENGTVVTDTETGYKFIFKNGRWIAK